MLASIFTSHLIFGNHLVFCGRCDEFRPTITWPGDVDSAWRRRDRGAMVVAKYLCMWAFGFSPIHRVLDDWMGRYLK